jgi:hypothetical protein
MLKRKEKEEKGCLFWDLNPPLSFNALDSDSSIFEYSSKWRL